MKQTPQHLSPMDYAMKYLTTRYRTESEMIAYLDSKDFGEADVDATIERLKSLGLIDDERFAKRFVETRLATKPISQRHLFEQLRAHGLSEEHIEAALAQTDEDTESENALSIARKFARQFRDLEPQKRRERVFSRLQARGFSYDVSRRAVEQALLEDECSES